MLCCSRKSVASEWWQMHAKPPLQKRKKVHLTFAATSLKKQHGQWLFLCFWVFFTSMAYGIEN